MSWGWCLAIVLGTLAGHIFIGIAYLIKGHKNKKGE